MCAGVAELVDALDLKSSGSNTVRVRFPPSAPTFSQMPKGIDQIGLTVVFYCHDGKGNFLMAKRKDTCRDEHGRWDPGGGSIELHDSVEDTLKREIREEYCTEILDFEFLGYRDVHRLHQGIKTHWISLDFKVLIDPELVKNGEPHKFEDIDWFQLEKLPGEETLHSQMPYFIKKYWQQLNHQG